MSKRQVYVWDTCVFLAHFKGETCHPQEAIDGMVETWDMFLDGSICWLRR